jgi:hypothetical protein
MLRSHNSGTRRHVDYQTTRRHIPNDHNAVLIFTPTSRKNMTDICATLSCLVIIPFGLFYYAWGRLSCYRPQSGPILSVRGIDECGVTADWQGKSDVTGEQDRQCTYKGISRRVRVTNVAVEEQ